MKQHFPLLLLLLLLPSLSIAQANYKKGLVVTTGGDTLRGFIDYREWDFGPTTISFRTSESGGTVQEFNAGNASYFEITGIESYQRYEGPISMDRVDKDNLSHGSPSNIITTDKVFLKKLQDGRNVALYYYKDKIKERFFLLVKGEDTPQELLYKRYHGTKSTTRILTQHIYVGQLINQARNQGILNEKLQRDIEAAAYKEQDLLRVVSKLNGLSDEEIAQDKQRKMGTRFFAGAAISRSTIEAKGRDDFVDPTSNPASYMPMLTFGFDSFLNRNVQRTILRLEMSLTNASYHLQADKHTGGGGYNELSYRITHQTASVSPQIIYNLYNKDNFKFYIGGGVVANYSNYSRNTCRSQYLNPTFGIEREPTEEDDYKKLHAIWSSYTVRTGVVLNGKYEAFAMYRAPGSITRYRLSELVVSSSNLGVNYLFRN